MCHKIGRPPISTIGLGLVALSLIMRVPNPPARITTFISILLLLGCVIVGVWEKTFKGRQSTYGPITCWKVARYGVRTGAVVPLTCEGATANLMPILWIPTIRPDQKKVDCGEGSAQMFWQIMNNLSLLCWRI